MHLPCPEERDAQVSSSLHDKLVRHAMWNVFLRGGLTGQGKFTLALSMHLVFSLKWFYILHLTLFRDTCHKNLSKRQV